MIIRTLIVFLVISGAAFPAKRVEVVVHRGENGHAPENTIAAAKRCVEIGVDYLEFDVRRSKDGVHYILHDPTVNRTSDGTGAMFMMTSDQIDALDAGSWFSADFQGERIPRLEALLDYCKGKIKLYFDVKDADLAYLIKLVHDRGLEHDCFFWFGNRMQAVQFRTLSKDLELKVNVSTPAEAEQAKRELGATLIECSVDNLTPEFIAKCRELGLRIMTRVGSADEAAFRRSVEAEVDLINLDYPEMFLRVQAEVLGNTK